MNTWITAGELFGAIRNSLPVGELTMKAGTSGSRCPPEVVVYRWGVKIDSKEYRESIAIPLEQLKPTTNVEIVSREIVSRWCEDARVKGFNVSKLELF